MNFPETLPSEIEGFHVHGLCQGSADDFEQLAWVNTITFPFWWVIMGIIGLLIIITGVRMIIRHQ